MVDTPGRLSDMAVPDGLEFRLTAEWTYLYSTLPDKAPVFVSLRGLLIFQVLQHRSDNQVEKQLREIARECGRHFFCDIQGIRVSHRHALRVIPQPIVCSFTLLLLKNQIKNINAQPLELPGDNNTISMWS